MQEAFIEADRRWRTVGQYDDPAVWIRRVAINRLRNGRRNRLRRAEIVAAIRLIPAEDLTDDLLAQLADKLLIWVDHSSQVDAGAYEEAVAPGALVVVFAHSSESSPGFSASIEGFATACAGGPPIGLVGTIGEWTELTTLDDLVVRPELSRSACVRDRYAVPSAHRSRGPGGDTPARRGRRSEVAMGP